MSLSAASLSLADRLVTACDRGDLPSAKAVVADGASVREEGTAPGFGTGLPLTAAVYSLHHDVVVWLLSHGADPNEDDVMWYGARCSTTAILQLMIDAGCDVNPKSGGQPPLFSAVRGWYGEGKVRVLLAQPSLDCTAECDGKAPEQWARASQKPGLADMIAQEVSGKGIPI